MMPIIGTFFGGKKATQSPAIPKPCFNYDFFNGSGATKVATGINCDGSNYLSIVTLGQSRTACLFEDTAGSSPAGLTITKGSAC
jgi:hypothetical protein